MNVNGHNLGWKLTFRQLMLDALAYDINYIFFSDQDDIWELNKIEKQVIIAKEKPEIEVLSHDFDILNTKIMKFHLQITISLIVRVKQ